MILVTEASSNIAIITNIEDGGINHGISKNKLRIGSARALNFLPSDILIKSNSGDNTTTYLEEEEEEEEISSSLTTTLVTAESKIYEEEFHYCSSSVSSSQDSKNSNSNVDANSNTNWNTDMNTDYCSNKRSVFSRYWKKTGHTPIPIRSMRSSSSSRSLSLITSDSVDSISSSYSTIGSPSPSTSSSFISFENCPLLDTVSNADLLEDDIMARPIPKMISTDYDTAAATPPTVLTTTAATTGTKGTERRRSILPAAPISHLVHQCQPNLGRETMTMNTRSWRKSASLSSLQGQRSTTSDHNRHILNSADKTRSSTRLLLSSSSSTPSASCLRPYQRYSPSKNNHINAATVAANIDTNSSNISNSNAMDVSLNSPTSISLSSVSSYSITFSSNVRFDLEAVDIRHFEPPKEKYAEKGWSEHFH